MAMPCWLHRRRQALLDALDAVLDVDRGERDVGAGLERGDDLDLAGGVAGRLVAERCRPRRCSSSSIRRVTRIIEVLRRGAGIDGRDRDRGRRDDRILRRPAGTGARECRQGR